jgi:hypothetical protein
MPSPAPHFAINLSLCIVSSSPPNFYKSIEPPIKFVTPDRHLDGVEWVLHYIVGIQLVYLLYHGIDVWLLRLSEEEELYTGLRLEALNAEVRALEYFDARSAHWEGLQVWSGG